MFIRPFRSWSSNSTQVVINTGLVLVFSALIPLAALAQANPRNTRRSASESPLAANVRALNNSLLQLHGQMQQGPAGSSRDEIRGQAATVIAERAAALKSLIEENPRAALSFAFSPELLSDLASKFPQSAALLESYTTVTGRIERWIQDGPGLKTSRSYFRMNVGSQILTLHFATREPNAGPDELVKATGVVIGSDMVIFESSSATARSSTLAPAPSCISGFGIPLLILLFGFSGLAFLFAIGARKRGVCRQFASCGVILGLVMAAPAISYGQGSCSTTGVQNVAVLLVNLPNGSLPSGVTQAAMQDVFFAANTPGVSLDGFLQAASYGQTSAAGAVFGPYNLTGTYNSCTDVGGAITNDAVAAAIGGGVDLGAYNRVFIVFPDIFNCGWGGFASVGGCTLATTSGTFNATVAWLSAAYVTPRAQGVEFASHEIGHNFGLLHSGTISTGTSEALGPLSSPGTETDLGDYWSTMGETVLGLYPAPQKAEVLNWITPSVNYEVVESSGTYTLQPMETSPAGLQVLKVERGTGSNEWLWIEYRQTDGSYDSTLLGPEAFTGALIHYEDPNTALGHTYLPDFTPNDTTGNNPALAAGQTWTDPYSNVSISVLSATSTRLTISVNYGAVPCTSSAPTVTVSPLNPSIYPGQSASYSVSVTNNDSSECASSPISLGSSEPSGWSTSLSSSSVTLSPGQSASVTVGKGAPSGTPPGTYAVNVNAANSSLTASGTANATVMAPPTLVAGISVPAQSFTPPGSVPITATVTNGAAPASGASVTFTVTTPSGGRATQTVTTGSNGTAAWNYKLNSRSAAGTYSVIAQAALSSASGGKKASTGASTQSATSNAVSFTVE